MSPKCRIKVNFVNLRPFALFVGTMSYPPNSDAAAYFARDILPLVRKSHPELKFVIVGRDPDRRVRELSCHSWCFCYGRGAGRFSVLSKCGRVSCSLQDFSGLPQ